MILSVGIRDKALSEKLQLETELTLERAINQVIQKEAVRKQQTVLRAGGDSLSRKGSRNLLRK